MILIDPRAGSGELLPYFQNKGIPVKVVEELPCGDFAFEGQGPEGRILIGVERKAIRDMITSIRSGRLAGHQLPMMKEMYGRSYVIVEGIYGFDERGLLTEPRRVMGGKTQFVPLTIGSQQFMHSMISRFIISIEETYRGHVRFHNTSSKEATANRVIDLFIEWQKRYESRHAWSACVDVHVEVRPWPLSRIIARTLPGVGDDNSLFLARAFDYNTVNMINATEEELAEIRLPRGEKDRKLGKVMAEKIWKGLREK